MGITVINGKAETVDRAAASYSQTIFVDQSGRGNFKNIQAAIDSVSSNNQNWVRIYVEPGVYREQITVPREKQFIYLAGKGKWKTSVVWGACQELDTSATFSVFADNFVARDISFVNSCNYPWNPSMSRTPAVAGRVQGDKNSFYNCGFVGLQDTLWDSLGRHYFSRCSIVGAVDFIFGAAQSMYEGCTLLFNGTALAGPGYITAQARGSADDPSGFVFKNCVVDGTGWTYLGRAWRPYARVIFSSSTFSNIIVPTGWDSWYTRHDQLNQLTFVEDLCHGPGSDNRNRIKWENQLNQEQLQQLTSISFIDNEGWIGRQPFNMLAH
ncbi:probable pectinesterase 29 [Daucus carota subsp. sativus]|nr:PREDICTED: probable pectinesterase 29 [Daucus carota subsp. sativus]